MGVCCFYCSVGFSKKPERTPAQNERQDKILIIASTEGEPYRTTLVHFYEHLNKRGFIKNQNLDVREYFIGNHEDTVANIWKHVIQVDKIKVVYVSGTTASIGAKKYLMNKDVKVVFTDVTDPIGVGLIENFHSPPKHNFTGVCFAVPVATRLRFIRTLLPKFRKIGYIYADMPSSTSYLHWLREELKKNEFKKLTLFAEKIPFIAGEGGSIRMSQIAEELIVKLNPQVDVFISPNDSLGGQQVFAKTIERLALKPSIGLQEREVLEGWGVAASIYIPLSTTGALAAEMVVDLLNGQEIKSLMPRCPAEQIVIDMNKFKKYKLSLPPSLENKVRKVYFEPPKE